jgi:signal transduction histidine kinase
MNAASTRRGGQKRVLSGYHRRISVDLSRLSGTGPHAAARQAAALFALAGLLALIGIVNDDVRTTELLIIAGADLTVAVITGYLPWHRWPPGSAAVLALPAFTVLGFSTWAFGGVATGTGPFLVLIYAWAALHFSRRLLLALSVPALAAYVVPLVVTGQPPMVLGSAMILLPVAVGIALLIEAQARHLRDDRERIAGIERWRAAMVATLAHDVRSPLTTVQMALEELREGPGDRTDGLIDAALRQTTRITRLATGLLDLDRIETHGGLRLDLRPVRVDDLIHEAVAHLGSADVKIEVDPQLVWSADPDRLEQIVVNLVGNSLRHGRTPVTVRAGTDGATARLEVRDYGPGVPESLRPRLFTRFGSDASDGVGLGLWIVRELARAHGGDAWHEEADPGARMIVTWPGGQHG